MFFRFAAAALCAIGVFALWFGVVRHDSAGIEPGMTPESRGDSQWTGDGVQDKATDAPLRHQVGAGTNIGVPLERFHGVVVDGTHGGGVAAQVSIAGVGSVFASAQTGRFSISGVGNQRDFLIRATGYQDKAYTLPVALIPNGSGVDLGVIALEPKRLATLRILTEYGVPVEGVRTQWMRRPEIRKRNGLEWLDEPVREGAEMIELLSDQHGLVSTGVSGRVVVAVLSPTGGQELGRLTIRGTEEKEFVLPSCLARIRFTWGGTGEPLVGEGIQSWKPGECDAIATSYTTDGDGWIDVLPSDQPILLSGTRQAKFYKWDTTSNRRLNPESVERGVGFESLVCGESLEVQVSNSTLSIELVDARSGLSIPDAYYHLEQGRSRLAAEHLNPREFAHAARRTETALWRRTLAPAIQNGVLQFPVDGSYEQLDISNSSEELVWPLLLVDGYAPRVLSEWNEILAGWQGPIALDPVPARFLRVVHPGGSEYRGVVKVLSPTERVVCFESDGHQGKEGPHGPFDWYGGGLRVLLGSHQIDVSPAQIESSEIIEVTYPVEAGSIRILGVPSTYGGTISALMTSGTWHEHSVESGEAVNGEIVWEIRGLAPGSYLVGPPEWCWGALHHRSSDLRSPVSAGSTTDVRWRAEWASESEISGQINLFGISMEQVYLKPFYGIDEGGRGATPSVYFGRHRSGRIPVSPSGKYTISVGDPVPSFIAVCTPWNIREDWSWRTDTNTVCILDTLRPGQSCDTGLGTFIFEWKGDRPDRNAITAVYGERSLQHGLDSPTLRIWDAFKLDPDGPVRLALSAPLSLSALRICGRTPRSADTGERTYFTRTVEVNWGSDLTSHLLLDNEKLASNPREITE